MYWSEDEIQSAVNEATKLFGKVGNMEHKEFLGNLNVSVATRQYGKLWYGDIQGNRNSIKAKLVELSKNLKQDVYLLPQDSFDFNTPLLATNN